MSVRVTLMKCKLKSELYREQMLKNKKAIV